MNTDSVMKKIDPVAFDAEKWRERQGIPFRIAKCLNKYLPRFKGAAPRFIGGLFPRSFKQYIFTKHAAKLAVHAGSLDIFTCLVNGDRTWNRQVFDTCASILKEGQVFYDIGANIGIIGIDISKVFDDKVTVIAFEPQVGLSETVAISGALNGFKNFSVFDFMIGDKESEVKLFLSSHSIHASSVPRESDSKYVVKKLVTIDKLVEQNIIPPPDLIKIDIEGGELAAFKGAEATLKKYGPHIVFEADENMQRYGYRFLDLVKFLGDCGNYEFSFIRSDGRLIPFGESSDRAAGCEDVLARCVDRDE